MSKPLKVSSLGFKPDARHPSGAGLLLFDLDDTIVQAGSHVSQRVLDALAAARAAGYVLSVASGRPLCMVHPKLLESGCMDYCACANGASVVRLADGERLVHRPMSREDALDCHEALREFKPAWNAFFNDMAYFEWKGASYMLTGRTGAIARVRRYTDVRASFPRRVYVLVRRGLGFARRLVTNRRQRQVLSIRPHLERAANGVEKIGCSIPNGELCAQAARILEEDGRYQVIRMGLTELEITAKGVTKATGASELMRLLGVSRERAFAFGDGGNDLPLASAVGTFVAMGNADDEVKEAADDVCPTVADDGVAVWLEQNLL